MAQLADSGLRTQAAAIFLMKEERSKLICRYMCAGGT